MLKVAGWMIETRQLVSLNRRQTFQDVAANCKAVRVRVPRKAALTRL